MIVFSGKFPTILQKYSYPSLGIIFHSTTLIELVTQSPLNCFPHVNYRPFWRHVATGVPERRGYDFVIRSHLVVVFVGLHRFLSNEYVHQRILQHQQQPNDAGKLRVPPGARRQLRRTTLIHSPTTVSTGHFNEPVHYTTQFIRAYYNR